MSKGATRCQSVSDDPNTYCWSSLFQTRAWGGQGSARTFSQITYSSPWTAHRGPQIPGWCSWSFCHWSAYYNGFLGFLDKRYGPRDRRAYMEVDPVNNRGLVRSCCAQHWRRYWHLFHRSVGYVLVCALACSINRFLNHTLKIDLGALDDNLTLPILSGAIVWAIVYILDTLSI